MGAIYSNITEEHERDVYREVGDLENSCGFGEMVQFVFVRTKNFRFKVEMPV